jgi:hypothetical protein
MFQYLLQSKPVPRFLVCGLLLLAALSSQACDPGFSYRPDGWEAQDGSYEWAKSFGEPSDSTSKDPRLLRGCPSIPNMPVSSECVSTGRQTVRWSELFKPFGHAPLIYGSKRLKSAATREIDFGPKLNKHSELRDTFANDPHDPPADTDGGACSALPSWPAAYSG